MIVGIFIVAMLIGLIPAAIAQGKGRSFFVWWIYGALIFIVALPHSLLMKADAKLVDARAIEGGDKKKCPKCAELIRQEASVCRFCGNDFPPAMSELRTAR